MLIVHNSFGRWWNVKIFFVVCFRHRYLICSVGTIFTFIVIFDTQINVTIKKTFLDYFHSQSSYFNWCFTFDWYLSSHIFYFISAYHAIDSNFWTCWCKISCWGKASDDCFVDITGLNPLMLEFRCLKILILASDINNLRLLVKENLLIKCSKPVLNHTFKSFPLKLFD